MAKIEISISNNLRKRAIVTILKNEKDKDTSSGKEECQ